MIKTLFFIPILIAFIFTSACAPEASSDATTKSDSADLVKRPTGQAAILARSLDFKNDDRISYCEVLGSDTATYSGFRDQSLLPLASLSKLITTAWALKKLGPDYKFKSVWYLKPVVGSSGTFDAYLKTNYDPIFNIEKVLYSLSLLNQSGVTNIRNLVIDETTRVYLSVLMQPHLELEQVPVSTTDSIQNLTLILNSKNWANQTQTARANLQSWAVENNRTLQIPNQFSVQQVQFRKQNEIDQGQYSKQIEVTSSSLLKYLKNLNVFSSNYMTDALFSYLGGVSEFAQFQSSVLKLTDHQLQFFSGSGLADSSSGVRKDNLGSCLAMINVLKYIDKLAAQNQLSLGQFLYNPTKDVGGTYESSLAVSNDVVLKTGRLYDNPALNLAGVISTEKGSVYFTFLGHQFSENEASDLEAARDHLLNSALKYYPLKPSFGSLKDFQIFIN